MVDGNPVVLTGGTTRTAATAGTDQKTFDSVNNSNRIKKRNSTADHNSGVQTMMNIQNIKNQTMKLKNSNNQAIDVIVNKPTTNQRPQTSNKASSSVPY